MRLLLKSKKLFALMMLAAVGVALWFWILGDKTKANSLPAHFESFMRTEEPGASSSLTPERDRSIEMFRRSGSNAVSFLVNELSLKSELNEKYASLKSSSPGWLFGILPGSRVAEWQRRQCAAKLLGLIGANASNAVPALVEAISKSEVSEADKSKGQTSASEFSPFARVEAVRALGRIAPNSREALNALIEALKQNDLQLAVMISHGGTPPGAPKTIADVALDGLKDLDERFLDLIPAVVANARYQNQGMYRGGISSIVLTGPVSIDSIPALAEALGNPSPIVRAAATYDLEMSSRRSAQHRQAVGNTVPTIAGAMSDVDPLVKIAAAEALLAVDMSQDQLVKPVAIGLLKDPRFGVRLRAIDLLRRIGPSAITASSALTNCLQDESRTIRTWAAETLRTVNSGLAVKPK